MAVGKGKIGPVVALVALIACGGAMAQGSNLPEQQESAPAAVTAGAVSGEPAAVPADAPGAGSETRFSLSLADEGSFYTGRRLPLPARGNLLLIQPSFAYRRGERWRFSTSLAGITNTYGDTHARLRVKETYFSLSAGDWDFALGKKIVRWGTGYAFTPTGVLDPPRLATDPTDRLGLNEGREMAAANWIRGRHSVTAAWASGGLLQKHRPGMRETTALRYNTLLKGFDTSAIYAHDRGGANFAGLNFTRVFGKAIELHGEIARRTGSEYVYIPALSRAVLLPRNDRTAALIGGKYTHHSGIGGIFEFYSSDGLLKLAAPQPGFDVSAMPGVGPGPSGRWTERRSYFFGRAGKSRLRELPGWKEWDVSLSVLVNVSDGSRAWIIDTERRFGNRVSLYGRAFVPGGKAWQSEYGMIPYQTQLTAGFRFQL